MTDANPKDVRMKLAALSEGFDDDMAVNKVKETQGKGDPENQGKDEWTLVTTSQGSTKKFEASRPDNDHTGESE